VATDSEFVCVLRGSCRRPGLGTLLRAHPEWKPDAAWKAGVPSAVGRVPENDGFNLFIAEGAGWKPVAAAVRRRMAALSVLIDEGRKIGADFELDIGVILPA
jgi:hypothetical protein